MKAAFSLLLIPSMCFAQWTESVWPASNHSPRELVYAYGETQCAKYVWVKDCYSALVERAWAVGSTNISVVDPWSVPGSTNIIRGHTTYYLHRLKDNALGLSQSYLANPSPGDFGLAGYWSVYKGTSISNANGYPSVGYGWYPNFLSELSQAATLNPAYATTNLWRDANESGTNNNLGWDALRRMISEMHTTIGGASVVHTNTYFIYFDGVSSATGFANPFESVPVCALPPPLNPCANPVTILTGSGTALWPFEQYSRSFSQFPVGSCGSYSERHQGSANVIARSRFGGSVTTNISANIVGVKFFRWSLNPSSVDDASDFDTGGYTLTSYDATYSFQTNVYVAYSDPMNTAYPCVDPPDSPLQNGLGMMTHHAASQAIIEWNFNYE